jgi:hypothetical protein
LSSAMPPHQMEVPSQRDLFTRKYQPQWKNDLQHKFVFPSQRHVNNF